MFGGSLTYPKKAVLPRKRSTPVKNDFHMSGPFGGGHYGHMAREPNTDYHVKMLQCKQRERETRLKVESDASHVDDRLADLVRFDGRCDRRSLCNEIDRRVAVRMRGHEEDVERRRTKLRQLMGTEEREYLREAVDKSQRGNEDRFAEMKVQAEMLKARREADRLKVVEAKRLQQYMARCQELRARMAELHLKESKVCQEQQMRENGARRESEREMDRMWRHLAYEEDQAQRERDVQDAIDKYNRDVAAKDMLDLQVKGKVLLKEEEKRVALEDRIEMEKLGEQLRRDEIEGARNSIDQPELTLRLLTDGTVLSQLKKKIY